MDLHDFATRVDLRIVGRRAMESLTKVGALDKFGTRYALLQALDQIISVSTSHHRAIEIGQLSLFGSVDGAKEDIHLPKVNEPDRKELLAWEKELIGLYVSAHPLTPYLPYLKKHTTNNSANLKEVDAKDKIKIGGMITRFRPHQTREGKPMGFITIEDLQGEVEMVAFPRSWEKCNRQLQVDLVVIAEGRVDNDGALPKVLLDQVTFVSKDVASKEPMDIEQTPAITETKKGLVAKPEKIILTPKNPEPEIAWDSITEDGEENFFVDESFFGDPEDMEGNIRASATENLLEMDHPSIEEISVINSIAKPLSITKNETSEVLPMTEAIPGDLDSANPVEGILTPGIPAIDYVIPIPDQNTRNRLTVILHASGDVERDLRKMKNIQSALLSYHGKDEFIFQIFESNKGYLIEFPNYFTGICPELLDRLKKLVDETSFTIEKVRIQ